MTQLANNTPEVRETLRLFCEAHAFCVALSEEIPGVLGRVPSHAALTEAQKTVHMLVERAAVWMQSLAMLPRATDYQAHASACRAMLEIAVDVALVTSEPALVERMWAWEESAKLKSCKRYSAYALKAQTPNPDQRKLSFIAKNEQTVKDLRKKHWGSEGHPRTWFGKPFEQVTAEADQRANASRLPGHAASNYEETYAKNYDELCWGTHGSSLSMIRQIATPDFLTAVSARALGESSRLALDLTERAATFLGLDGEAICNELFTKMQALQERYRLRLLAEIGSGGEGIPRPDRA